MLPPPWALLDPPARWWQTLLASVCLVLASMSEILSRTPQKTQDQHLWKGREEKDFANVVGWGTVSVVTLREFGNLDVLRVTLSHAKGLTLSLPQ